MTFLNFSKLKGYHVEFVLYMLVFITAILIIVFFEKNKNENKKEPFENNTNTINRNEMAKKHTQ